jgi:hypothetical protein
MGFFMETEALSLRLSRRSFHIVTGTEEAFVPQPEQAVEHDDFLLSLIKEIASDSIYRFAEISTTRSTIEAIAARSVSFEAGAQALASDFCRFHRGSTKDGAFFVFELGVDDPNSSIYALLKYDYGEALELERREGANGLRRILEAFIYDKSSIQKAAIVRTVDGLAEAQISTRDRMGRPSPLLTKFFIDYLQLVRDRSDQELTIGVRDVVRTALHDHREFLPPGGLAMGVSRAFDVLRAAPAINESVIKQAVWAGAGQPSEEETQGILNAGVGRLLRRNKLEGVEFPPDQSSLPRAVRRRVRTDEGVTIEYSTGLEGQAVRRVEQSDGSTQFIITTRAFKDDIIPDKVGTNRR